MVIVKDPRKRRNVQTASGSIFFLTGLFTTFIACLITVALWLTGTNVHPWVSTFDTVLFLIGLVLIIFAGVCLDWADRRRE